MSAFNALCNEKKINVMFLSFKFHFRKISNLVAPENLRYSKCLLKMDCYAATVTERRTNKCQ